jgi:tRNA A-37 threonylcarbamoyl transferase component Bud32
MLSGPANLFALMSLPQNIASPDEWIRLDTDGIHTLCRRDAAAALAETYGQHRWVYDALIARNDTLSLRGRRPVLAGDIGSHRCVVKRMHHGGLMTHIAGDAFLTSRRARAHITLAEYLNSKGIATPKVIFVSWRRVHGLVRAEIGFEHIEGAFDADSYFFERSVPPEDWEARAAQVGSLVAGMHRANFLHADLNLMNFLFSRDRRTYILDLDKTTLRRRGPSESERSQNLERLERSIRKQGRNHLSSLVESIVRRVRTSYREALVAAHAVVGAEILLSPEVNTVIEQLSSF